MSTKNIRYSGEIITDRFWEVPVESTQPIEPERDFIVGRALTTSSVHDITVWYAYKVIEIFKEVDAQVDTFVQKNARFVTDFQKLVRGQHYSFVFHWVPVDLELQTFSLFTINWQEIQQAEFPHKLHEVVLRSVLWLNTLFLSWPIDFPKSFTPPTQLKWFFSAKNTGRIRVYYNKERNLWMVELRIKTKDHIEEREMPYSEFMKKAQME